MTRGQYSTLQCNALTMDVLYIASILLTVHCCGIVGAAPVPATSVVSPWNNTATGNTGRVIQLIGTGDDDNSSGAASWSQVIPYA